jgi:hypothetical protein
MKRLIVLFTLIACLSALSQAEIEKKYDRFTQTTTVASKPIPPERGNPRLFLLATYPGEKPPANLTDVGFFFVSCSKDWEYLSCNSTNFLIDGKPYSPGAATHKGHVSSGDVLEYLIYPKATFSTIKKLAAATKVEVKICNTEFVLSAKGMNDLKEFVRLLTPE